MLPTGCAAYARRAARVLAVSTKALSPTFLPHLGDASHRFLYCTKSPLCVSSRLETGKVPDYSLPVTLVALNSCALVPNQGQHDQGAHNAREQEAKDSDPQGFRVAGHRSSSVPIVALFLNCGGRPGSCVHDRLFNLVVDYTEGLMLKVST
jgi:hypothetical protein